mgnify:CR=1 FL=1
MLRSNKTSIYIFIILYLLLVNLQAEDIIWTLPQKQGILEKKTISKLLIVSDTEIHKIVTQNYRNIIRIKKNQYEIIYFPGYVSLKIEMDKSQILEESFYLQGGTKYQITIDSKHDNNFTTFLDTNPSGAAIYFDEKYMGKSPLKIETKYGNHRIKIIKKLYEQIKKDIYVKSDTIFKYDLEENYAILSIIPKIDSVKVYFDEKFIGYSPLRKKITLAKHKLTLIRKHYYEYSEEFLAKPNGLYPKDQNYGIIKYSLNTIPKANVYIDSLYAGQTPFEDYLSKGRHSFILKKEGYEEYYYNIELIKNRNDYIRLIKK